MTRIDVDLEFECKVCGNNLDIEENKRDSNYFFIEPCDACKEKTISDFEEKLSDKDNEIEDLKNRIENLTRATYDD